MSKDHEQLRDFYNDKYYSKHFRLDTSSWHDQVIASRLGDLAGKRVLDIACGGGAWLALMSQRGAHVFGADISDKAISYCQQVFPQGEFVVAPAESLPFPDHSFDVVTCLGSLEHFGDKPAALREMLRVAKPDAQILILVPNADFLSRKLGLYRGTLQAAIREDVYPLSQWQDLFESNGMELRQKWRDLHILSRNWILQKGWLKAAPRAIQALLLTFWPLKWQYQVYHLLTRKA